MAALSVEHLKVMAASRACLRIQFTYWVGGLWSSASGPYGRAPKGPYQSSPVGPLPFGRAPKGSIDLLGSQISN